MVQAVLSIDLSAIRANWRALAAKSAAPMGAVVKADAYGLGVAQVSRALAQEGARSFFVAQAEEGRVARIALGPGPEIFLFSGHMAGDHDLISEFNLTPLLNNIDQVLRHVETLPRHGFGLQLDTGMNRLGIEPEEWAPLRPIILEQKPRMLMSHLACADTAADPMNEKQLQSFSQMTAGLDVPRSLAATGGILLGPQYHFDMVRPGIGLYGGAPFLEARPVVTLEVPIIQTRDVKPGESVGYGNSWVAQRASRIATLNAGYADGILRALSGREMMAYHNDVACPFVGRVSMDMIGVDISGLTQVPTSLTLLGDMQRIDDCAAQAGTIGYEILTSLGRRYCRDYRDAGEGL